MSLTENNNRLEIREQETAKETARLIAQQMRLEQVGFPSLLTLLLNLKP